MPGEPPQLDAEFEKGYFFQPTIFGDVTNQMVWPRRRSLVTVVSVLSFKDEEDLIRQANETIYGTVSRNLDQQHNARHRLQKKSRRALFGSTLQHVQCSFAIWRLQTVRLRPGNGQAWLEMYTNVKSVWVTYQASQSVVGNSQGRQKRSTNYTK